MNGISEINQLFDDILIIFSVFERQLYDQHLYVLHVSKCRTEIFMETQKSTDEEREEEDVVHCQNQSAASPDPSCVSMKSDRSINLPPVVSDGAVTSGLRCDVSAQRHYSLKLSSFLFATYALQLQKK